MKYIINSNNLDSYSRNIESGVETNGIKSNDFDSYNGFESQEEYILFPLIKRVTKEKFHGFDSEAQYEAAWEMVYDCSPYACDIAFNGEAIIVETEEDRCYYKIWNSFAEIVATGYTYIMSDSIKFASELDNMASNGDFDFVFNHEKMEG